VPSTISQKKKMIESEFGSGNPTTHYLGISLANPLENGTGVIEPSTSYGYTRVAITNNKTTWTDYVNGEVSNKIAFEFPEIIDQNWNTLEQPLYLFLATSATGTGDDIKYYVELTGTDKKLLQVGAIVRFPVGVFKIKA
jgi:hypothetical protein